MARASILEDLPGSTMPIKNFDPAGLASLGSEETLRWLQAGEIKNGRCAMVAVTGFLIQAAGLHFPGMLSHDVSFESLSGLHPFDQWAAVPDAGKAQILFTCFLAEMITSTDGLDNHVLKVRPPLPFKPEHIEVLVGALDAALQRPVGRDHVHDLAAYLHGQRQDAVRGGAGQGAALSLRL